MAELDDRTQTRCCYVCGEAMPQDRRIVFVPEDDGARMLATAVHLDGDCSRRVDDGPSLEWLTDRERDLAAHQAGTRR